MTGEEARGRPTVQLRHEGPDGSWHVDWLLATDEAGAAPLVSFRLPDRIDRLPAGAAVSAERIADHRPRYLDYEGPLSRGRGAVTRLRRGLVRGGDPVGDPWRLQVHWREPPGDDVTQSLEVAPQADGTWIVRVLATTAAAVAQYGPRC